jgi:hypothetical protein
MQNIRNQSAFTRPYAGQLKNGAHVRILATGDVEGNSPSFLVAHEDGTCTWETITEVRLTDSEIVPAAAREFAGTGTSKR